MEENKNKKKLNVPPLRFPGFTDEWKKNKVGNLFDISVAGDIDKSAVSLRQSSQNPYPIISNSLENDGIYGYTDTYKCEAGTITVTGRGTLGIAKSRDYRYYPIVRLLSLHPHNCIDFNFGQYAINKIHFYFEITGVPQLTAPQLSSYDICFPSIAEQKKIANLLLLIDQRIATQNKIIEDLKKLKSAIYDAVFRSLNGKLSSLGDVAEIIKGNQVNGEFLSDDGDYYVMNGGVEPSGYYHSCNTLANTISISEGGNSCGYIQWNIVPFWSGGHCYTLNIKDSAIENKFLYHFLKWREADIMKLRIGSGLPNIQKKDLAKVTIEIPKNPLQSNIVRFLDSTDIKIENEKSVLELYNRQRVFLLSSMLI